MYILSKHLDWLLAGGVSVIVYIIISLLHINLFDYNIAQIAFALALIINHPHFISSYIFFYKDERALILKSKLHFLAGVIFPLGLLYAMIFAFVNASPHIFTYIINGLFFFVGLHYVRQVYGVSLISLAKHKIFLSKKDKWILNLSMFPLWFVSFLNGYTAVFTSSFYGIPYTTFALPSWFTSVNNVLVVASVIAWGYLIRKIYMEHSHHIPLTLIAALASIFVWHFPSFYNSGFAYLIPMFHSLQYLLITAAVKKNQILTHTVKKFQILEIVTYCMVVFIFAYLAFHFIPESLDNSTMYNVNMFGYTAILGMFLLFINLHHYAMDALLWRKGSRLTKYL